MQESSSDSMCWVEGSEAVDFVLYPKAFFSVPGVYCVVWSCGYTAMKGKSFPQNASVVRESNEVDLVLFKEYFLPCSWMYIVLLCIVLGRLVSFHLVVICLGSIQMPW